MKKILMAILCTVYAGSHVPIMGAEGSIESTLTPEGVARLNKIKIFDIPGTEKRLYVDTEQLTRYANVIWAAVLLNHKPNGNMKALFYSYSMLTALLNFTSRGYGNALYVLGAALGTEYLNIGANDETCKTHLLRGLMTSQFVNGLYEIDKIVANPFGLRVAWIR